MRLWGILMHLTINLSPGLTDIDEEDLMWEGSRERRRLRTAASYKKQMEMLGELAMKVLK